MHSLVRRTVFSLILLVLAAPAAAQSDGPLQQGRGFVFGSLGMQSDLGGAVNESGVGVVNGLRAEIDTNTWGERYDASLNFRIGGAYNLTTYAQLFAEVTWEQSEADATEIGLIGGQPLIGKFSDYQGWGIDVGYRRLFNSPLSAKPFASFAFGFQRHQDITLDLSSTVYNRAEIPFYDDSWVFGWRLGTGFLWDINDRLGWLLTLDLKYSGMLSDQSGIGTVGFERINKGGNRWTVPIMAGAYVKF
jgi:hypothetical protein